ncbi:glucosylglycerol hydrolase [Halapricum desulfuricans]|uniref:glucosylglycerol hydrolase n=1 Tax=Halapricum desulfuricans TaxID=2841257 RepID=UPI003AB94E9B
MNGVHYYYRSCTTVTANVRLLDEPTEDLRAWHRAQRERHDDDFEAAKEIVTRLGAHYEDGVTEIGFWTPEIVDAGVPHDDVYLEVLTPTEDVRVFEDGVDQQTIEVRRDRLPIHREGEYHWAVVEGMRPGTREQFGSLYQLVYREDGEWHTVQDPLAYSVPFGVFGPAELIDLDTLDAERDDREYFEHLGTDAEPIPTSEDDGLPRIEPATSMVEIHPGTATENGSLGGLARRYDRISEKLRTGEDLTAGERIHMGYDGIQLMPIEPITEHRENHEFWQVEGDRVAPQGGETAELIAEQPDLINWGYDIVIRAFSAPNPAILETGRPHELVDFIAACHNLPEPIRIVFDIALGHAEGRADELLDEEFIEGPGMYGLELDYLHPVVRATVLELQRRKMDFGADGIRVDGAQDFKYYDPGPDELFHDDEFLAEMDEVTQEVGGTEYRPWMIYEDGRPWPRGDWELASTYRELIKQHPHSFQWSPITFAHNKPALLTFWASKWWRVFEVADFGSNWITGVANHDTLRRGTQQPLPKGWEEDPINPYLGDDGPEIIDEAYDQPSTNMLLHCLLPGVPMDFLNANAHAPWSFMRDTDDEWNVKVVAEEDNVLDWHVPAELYDDDRFFGRLKSMGIDDRDDLDHFVHVLHDVGEATDWELEDMAATIEALGSPLAGETVTPEDLERFSEHWMADVNEFANLSNWLDTLDPDRAEFTQRVREFRQDRPWLLEDIDVDGSEVFDYVHPVDGTVVYYGFRASPDGDEQVLFVGNMEGPEVTVEPTGLDPSIPADGWEPALASPGTAPDLDTLTLDNGQAVVWTRRP